MKKVLFPIIITSFLFLNSGFANKKRISANYVIKIKQLLNKNNKVSIIIHVPERSITIMSNPPITNKQAVKAYKKTVSQKIYSGKVRILMDYFGTNKRFSIVNRNNLKAILEEHKLSQTGLLNQNNRLKIGNLAGANYILSVTHTTTVTQTLKAYLTIDKLIDISTGKELSTDEAHIQMKKENSRMKKTYQFNGREVNVIGNKIYEK